MCCRFSESFLPQYFPDSLLPSAALQDCFGGTLLLYATVAIFESILWPDQLKQRNNKFYFSGREIVRGLLPCWRDTKQSLAIPCFLGWAGCRQSIALVLFSTSQRSSTCFQAANNGIYFL